MARSSANDIELTVGLEAGDVTDAAEELRSSIKGIFDANVGKPITAAFASLQNSMANVYQRSINLQNQLEALKTSTIPTETYTNLQKKIEEVGEQLSQLRKEKEKFESAGFSEDQIPDSFKADLEEVEQQFKNLNAEKQQLESTGEAFVPGTETEKYESLVQQLASANNQMSVLLRRSEDMDMMAPPTSQWGTFSSVLAKVGHLLGTVAKGTAILTIVKPLQLATEAAKRLAKALGQVASSAIKTGMNGVARAVFGIKKSSDSTNDSINKGIKLFIKYAFGVRSFFFLYRKIRKAITEGFGDMAQVSAPLNNQLSQLATSMLYLRNAVTSAFAPIASFVIPILTTLINVLAAAANAVAQFMAALFGQTSFVKAKKVYKDYTASLDKGAAKQQKNASKTQKKVDKLQKTIAGFDDVNILESKDDDKSPSGGGGGGGGAGGGMPWQDPSNMFETTSVEAKFKKLADKIKGFFKKGDWEGLGKFIADGINTGFEAIDKVLTSTKVQERLSYIVNAITRTFNSLVKNINWPLIGKTFGDGINLIVKTLNQLYTGIQWYSLGASIAKGLNSLVTTIDWTSIGNLFANKFNALINFAYGAILNFDWANLGKSFGKAINGFFLKVQWNTLARTLANLVSGLFSGIQNIIDTVNWRGISVKLTQSLNSFIRGVNWKNVGKTLSSLIMTALNFIETAIDNFDWIKLGTSIGNFLVGIDWIGIILKVIQVALKAFLGLATVLLAGLDAILTNIFNSVSKTVQGLGKNVAQGLYKGISSVFKKIGSWVKDNVFTPFINAVKKIFGISSPAKTMQGPGKDISSGLLKGIADGLKSIGSWVKTNVFNKIKSAIITAFGIAGSVAKNIITQGKSITEGLYKGIKDKLAGVASWVKTNVFNKIKSALVSAFGIAKGIAGNLKSIGESVISGIKKGITSKFDGLKDYVKDIPKNLKNAMPNVFELFKSIGTDIADGIKSGISNKWESLKKYIKDKSSELKGPAKEGVKSNSPSKLFRDEVGITIPQGIAAGIDKGYGEAIKSVNRLTSGIVDAGTQSISLPPIVGGQVIPYSIGKADAEEANTTLNQVLDMLKYNKDNAISIEEIQSVFTELFRRYMNVQLYLGDEQVARHANAGNAKLNRRYNTT